MPTVRDGLLLVAMATALCGCSTGDLTQTKEDDPIVTQKILRDANVRDPSVLWTEESLGGAALTQEEWADYLYDAHHTGVAVSKENKDTTLSDAKSKEEKQAVTEVKGNKKVEKKSDDKTLEDRSIYSRDRSIYAKHQAKARTQKAKSVAKAQSVGKTQKSSSAQKKKSKYKVVKTHSVGGKKVSETIVELKDPPKTK